MELWNYGNMELLQKESLRRNITDRVATRRNLVQTGIPEVSLCFVWLRQKTANQSSIMYLKRPSIKSDAPPAWIWPVWCPRHTRFLSSVDPAIVGWSADHPLHLQKNNNFLIFFVTAAFGLDFYILYHHMFSLHFSAYGTTFILCLVSTVPSVVQCFASGSGSGSR